MTAPVILLVMGKSDARSEREIRARYGADYEVVGVETASTAKSLLRALTEDGKEVALLLTALRLPDASGEDLLAAASALHSNIKRGLLVSWNDDDARDRIFRAMSLGYTDSWAYAPVADRDEQFHRSITELLEEWDRWNGVDLSEIVVVGPRISRECIMIHDVLLRSGYPHRSAEVDSPEGQHVLKITSSTLDQVPLVYFPNGRVLPRPTRRALIEACGVRTKPGNTNYDVAIIGAGPAGLSAATYASSEGLRTALIEQDTMGGQAGSSALIRNYLGFPRGISGPELASRAYQQAWLFGADLLYGASVSELRRSGEFLVLSRPESEDVRARAVIIATGVQYRQLGIPSVDALSGAGVFYGSAMSAAASLAHEEVVIVGGGNSAGQAALYLAKHEANITMLVRGESFAESMSQYLIDEIERAPNIRVCFESELADAEGEGRLEHVVYRHRLTGTPTRQRATAMFIFIGMQPLTAWLPPEVERDNWGFIRTGQPGADQPSFGLQTSMPGVFAVGDVRHGSVKRVASAVGEGSICIAEVHAYLDALGVHGSAHAR